MFFNVVLGVLFFILLPRGHGPGHRGTGTMPRSSFRDRFRPVVPAPVRPRSRFVVPRSVVPGTPVTMVTSPNVEILLKMGQTAKFHAF
jgi:hypothetical protein